MSLSHLSYSILHILDCVSLLTGRDHWFFLWVKNLIQLCYHEIRRLVPKDPQSIVLCKPFKVLFHQPFEFTKRRFFHLLLNASQKSLDLKEKTIKLHFTILLQMREVPEFVLRDIQCGDYMSKDESIKLGKSLHL